MSNYSLNHIALSVKDVTKSIQFYQKVLQFKEIKNTASNSKTRWLSLDSGIQLHLIPRPNAEIKVNKAVHFALSTTDLDAFLKRLYNLRINFTDWQDTPERGYIRKDGIRQVYFQDPNGYWIEMNDDV